MYSVSTFILGNKHTHIHQRLCTYLGARIHIHIDWRNIAWKILRWHRRIHSCYILALALASLQAIFLLFAYIYAHISLLSTKILNILSTEWKKIINRTHTHKSKTRIELFYSKYVIWMNPNSVILYRTPKHQRLHISNTNNAMVFLFVQFFSLLSSYLKMQEIIQISCIYSWKSVIWKKSRINSEVRGMKSKWIHSRCYISLYSHCQ